MRAMSDPRRKLYLVKPRELFARTEEIKMDMSSIHIQTPITTVPPLRSAHPAMKKFPLKAITLEQMEPGNVYNGHVLEQLRIVDWPLHMTVGMMLI